MATTRNIVAAVVKARERRAGGLGPRSARKEVSGAGRTKSRTVEAARGRPWPAKREKDDCGDELHDEQHVEGARDGHIGAEYPIDDGQAAERRRVEVPHFGDLRGDRQRSRVAQDVELRGATHERD